MGKGVVLIVVLIMGIILGFWLSGNCPRRIMSLLMTENGVLNEYNILKEKYSELLLENKDLKNSVKELTHERDVLAKENSELQEASHLRWNNFWSMYE